MPEVPTTQLTVIRTEGSGEGLWGLRLVKTVGTRTKASPPPPGRADILFTHILFLIFSDKEPGIGRLEKGQLNNNDGNKNVKIKKGYVSKTTTLHVQATF